MITAQSFRAAIFEQLGHAPEVIEPDKLHRFATSSRRGDSSGWAKLFEDGRAGVFGDWRTGFSQVWTASSASSRQERAELARQVAAATAERERVQRTQWADNARRIAKLWSECQPLALGDPVTLYLKRRGFGGVWPLPECLRLHRALPYWHGTDKLGTFPAMVAPLVAPDGRAVALHRTYLQADGRKADVPSVKKLTAASGPLAGACIPLFKPEHGVLGLAEGIETALAGWCGSGVPTVAAYCAGNLAAWQWPPGVRHIVVFADNDPAGAEAAGKLRQRARAAGLAVKVMAPTEPGSDWCDVWGARDAA
ncbi:MAG TPA: toprim domain-containing protein [Rubrivivax sp.]|nr:toprim domain-containing protein [Rubrivivax sp.]